VDQNQGQIAGYYPMGVRFPQHDQQENVMNKNFSFVIGRTAALSIAVETTVFSVSLIRKVIFPTEFAKNLEYFARQIRLVLPNN
jgi:hypothetical protein